MCGVPRCRACSGGFFEQQLPAGAQHAGDHGDGRCHWGTWWMMPKSTTVSWLAPGCWMLQTSPAESDTARRCRRLRASSTMVSSRSTAATRRQLVRHAIRYRPRAPLFQRLIAGCRTRRQRPRHQCPIDGTQGPKCGDVTRHIMVIDVNTEALELGSAPPAGSSGAHSSPRQTRPIRWPTPTG